MSTNDEERVTDLFGRLLASGVELDDRELDMIVEVLAAVRLDERRAIVTLLRRLATDERRSSMAGAAALHHGADQIERGKAAP